MWFLMNLCFLGVVVAIVYIFANKDRPMRRIVALVGGLWLLASGVIFSNLSLRKIDNYSYRADAKLIDSIAFVEAYEAVAGQLPTLETFEDWADAEYPNWGLMYNPHNGNQDRNLAEGTADSGPYYRIEGWTGDEVQIYDSFGHSLSYDFDLN